MITFLDIAAIAIAGIAALGIVLPAGWLIYERFRMPVEDGHTRAAEREERWYPLR